MVVQDDNKATTASGFQARQVINLHKLLVVPVYLLIVLQYSNLTNLLTNDSRGPVALMLLVSHGFYGLAWVFKDIHFPDDNWKKRLSIPFSLFIFFINLGVYYLPMFCLMSDKCPLGKFGEGNETGIVALGAFFFQAGLFVTFCADLQKYIIKQMPGERRLLTTGFFKYTRNPNYLGEIMLYSGYAIWSMSYFVMALFILNWAMVMMPSMIKKERSLSRYPDFEKWSESSCFLAPNIALLLSDMIKYSFSPSPEEMKNKMV